ncbi:MAG: type IV pilus biogenesis/stability protein PilW [Pseudomonadales bacterium]|nr:type IV pilus biogenesis/stability protein PilW [Pseudomonadales bacterium]
MMQRLSLITVFTSLLLLSACVTETSMPQKTVDKQAQLKAFIDLGVGYIRNREYQRAKDNLQKALQLDPRSPDAHNLFGLVFQLEGEYEVADQYFRKAIEYDPYFTRARNNYGAFLYEQRRFEEAVQQLRVASEDRLYNLRPQVFENLGVALQRLDRKQEAEEAFTRAIQLNPEQPRSLLELSEIRYDQNQFLESRSFYRRYVRGNQQSARSLWLGIRLARRFGDTNEEASLSLVLKNIFPASDEYAAYKRTVR